MIGSLSRKQAILLGLVVLIGLGLGALGLFAVGGRQGLWQQQFEITAEFPRVNGLEVGTRVRVQGMNAGQVVAIEQPEQRGGAVLVRLQLERKFRTLLGSDAHAEIVSEGMIGGKSVELHPGTPRAEVLADGVVIPGRSDQVLDELRKLAGQSDELLDEVQALAKQTKRTMAEAQELLRDLRQGEGTMGKEIAGTLKQVQETSASVGQGFDALKSVPMIGKYVDASTKLLIRPNVDRHVITLREEELFEPGRAILRLEGQARLAEIAAQQLPRFKVPDSEVVIVAYTSPPGDARSAEILTQQQAEAVVSHLIDEHGITKLGWIKRRNVTALGMGLRPPPGGPTPPGLSPRRVEIVIFVPPGSVRTGA